MKLSTAQKIEAASSLSIFRNWEPQTTALAADSHDQFVDACDAAIDAFVANNDIAAAQAVEEVRNQHEVEWNSKARCWMFFSRAI